MAGTFKNVLSTPESLPSITYDKLLGYEVDVINQRCTVRLAKCDSSDNVISRRTETFDLTGTDLTTPSDSIFASAQAAGKTPAGTISEV